MQPHRVEPPQRAQSISPGEIEVHELEQRLASGRSIHCWIECALECRSALGGRSADAAEGLSEADPELAAPGRRSTQRAKCLDGFVVETRSLAGVDEQREPYGRAWNALEQRLSMHACLQWVASLQPSFGFASLVIGASRNDFDPTEPPRHAVCQKSHGADCSPLLVA